jgi:hypothetical protein
VKRWKNLKRKLNLKNIKAEEERKRSRKRQGTGNMGDWGGN